MENRVCTDRPRPVLWMGGPLPATVDHDTNGVQPGLGRTRGVLATPILERVSDAGAALVRPTDGPVNGSQMVALRRRASERSSGKLPVDDGIEASDLEEPIGVS